MSAIERALAHMRSLSDGPPLDRELRVTLHFHPDTPYRSGTTLKSIAHEGFYRSQFETRISNGGLTAHTGGDRWRWESIIFGGAYDDGPDEDRPKYGSLDVTNDPYGASPRFGSSYFRLAAHTLDRTTFCFPDSVFDPYVFGTATAMTLPDIKTPDPLDSYVEAHVHGPIHIATDVEALVLDPSYRGSPTEATATALDIPVEWHAGYRLSTDKVDENYRGRHVAEVARTIGATLTPRVLGLARRGPHDPQDLKKVWHLLARYGR